MPAPTRLFKVEPGQDVLVVIPRENLGEFHFHDIEDEAGPILQELGPNRIRDVVFDLDQADYCGSSALAFLLRVWKRVRDSQGHMALCNVRPGIQDVLTATRLDAIWPQCASRAEAVAAVRKLSGRAD